GGDLCAQLGHPGLPAPALTSVLQHALHGAARHSEPCGDILLGWPGATLSRAVQPEEGQQHPLLLSRQAPGHSQAGPQRDTEQAGISRRDVLVWVVQGHRWWLLVTRRKVLRQAF